MNNFRKNIMGTTSFTAKFEGMRKEQEFIVYPIAKDGTEKTILCQSDSRWLEIDSETGECWITSSQGGHHNRWMLQLQKVKGKAKSFVLSGVDLQTLKMQVFTTANSNAGSSIVKTDNSGAIRVI